MATAPQKKVLEVIKNKIMDVDERYTDYHTDIMKTLYEILALENDPPYNIAQEVSRQIKVLGELLVKKDGNIK